MPTSEIILAIIITLAFAALIPLCVIYLRNQELLETQHQTAAGTVTKRVFQQNFGNSFDRVTVRYTVNGKEYEHAFNTRPDKYRDDETVEIFYLPQKPQRGSAACELGRFPKHAVKALFIGLIVLYCFIMLLLLFAHRNTVIRNILDCCYVPLAAVAAFYEWRSYSKQLRQGVRTRGTVVYTREYRQGLNIWAEYTADGKTCETIQKIPPKHRTRDYAVGEPVDLCYSAKEPANAILAEEPYASKKEGSLRTASILTAILSVVYIAGYIAISLIFQ
ncbi:MAG: hypothetical protein IK130_02955 [Oscillospiraceae bacterium]|nr:hypothetical protein [Oscillospiraceae bacterium]